MLTASARQDIARAYGEGLLIKHIAYRHGISEGHVSVIAKREGQRPRHTGRPAAPRAANPAEVLALFRSGLDTVSIAARLMLTQCAVANALADARDREHSR